MGTKSQQPEKNKIKKFEIDKKPNKKDYDGQSKEEPRENNMAKGGRAGFKVGGAAKRGISKILRKK